MTKEMTEKEHQRAIVKLKVEVEVLENLIEEFKHKVEGLHDYIWGHQTKIK